MKSNRTLLTVTLLSLALSILAAKSFAAGDGDNSCYLQAPDQDDVYVIVYNEDGEGNRTDMIWQGTIAAGQQKLITSRSGRIRYDMSFTREQPAEGDLADWCDQLNTIGIMP
jgi:hypothetical protein